MATVVSRGTLTRDYWKVRVRAQFMLLVPSYSHLEVEWWGKFFLEFSLLGRCENSLGKWRARILPWVPFPEKIPGALDQSPRNYAGF